MHMTLAMVALLAAAPKFTPYDSKADGFHIDFPGKPKTETSKDKSMVTRSYTVDNEFGVYLVLVINDPDIGPENAKELFDGFRETEKEDGKVVSDKQVTLGSLTGIELKTLGKDADTLARMFVTKGRSYSVIMDADHGHTFPELGAEQFFSSFTLGEKTAPAPAPTAKPTAPQKEPELSSDSVELFGWSADGTKVVAIEHGIYDGKGTAWAKASFIDTTKGQVLGKPLQLELEGDGTRADAVIEMKKRAEAERVRLKWPALVPGKVIKTDDKGALTSADGSPVGNLELKSRAAGKKERVRECPEGFSAEILTAKLYLMGGDGPITVLAEKKTPATRACSMGCVPSSTYGQGKGALFVLKCSVQGFEGADSTPMLLPLGKLEYPLEADLPPQ